MMMLRSLRLVLLLLLFLLPFDAFSGGFDGSISLNGSVDKIVEINPSKIKTDVSPETIGLPRHFRIDFKNRLVKPSKDSIIRKHIRINHLEHLENKLVLQGIDDGVENVEDGLAWSLVISKLTGKAILAASGDGVAYVVFGTCTPGESGE
jgi:hypothetical protein